MILDQVTEVNSEQDFESVLKKDGCYNFVGDNLTIETVIQNISKRNDKRLFVLLSGARDPDKHPLPKFDRWKWAKKFPGITLNISDPALHFYNKRLRIGWYFGTNDIDYSHEITQLVKKIANHFSIKPSDVIFYGSSAGGFGSLAMSTKLEGSTSVVINPQILLRNYIPGIYRRFLQESLGVESEESISDKNLIRMDAAKMFLNSSQSKCLYIQNEKDISHYEKHFLYFCNMTNASTVSGISSDKRIVTEIYSSDGGHGPEPSNMVDSILEKALVLSMSA